MNAFLSILESKSGLKDPFAIKISREFQMKDEYLVKPHPYSLEYVASTWRLKPEEILMVGDSNHDIECGQSARTKTCLLRTHGFDEKKLKQNPDLIVDKLIEITHHL